MSLGLTQPLTEMSTRNNSWGKGGHVPIVLKSGSLNLLETSGPVMGLLYIYLSTNAELLKLLQMQATSKIVIREITLNTN